VIVASALAAPAVRESRQRPKLALLTMEGFIGRAIHVDTVLGRINLHGKVRSVQEKANDTNEIK
jgi:hypothetical protein